MGFFNVLVHGTGIRIPALDGDGEVVGFYRVEKVRAASASLAAGKALDAVREDWRVGRCASHGARPALEVEQVDSVSLLRYLSHRNGAHIFYPDET